MIAFLLLIIGGSIEAENVPEALALLLKGMGVEDVQRFPVEQGGLEASIEQKGCSSKTV